MSRDRDNENPAVHGGSIKILSLYFLLVSFAFADDLSLRMWTETYFDEDTPRSPALELRVADQAEAEALKAQLLADPDYFGGQSNVVCDVHHCHNASGILCEFIPLSNSSTTQKYIEFRDSPEPGKVEQFIRLSIVDAADADAKDAKIKHDFKNAKNWRKTVKL